MDVSAESMREEAEAESKKFKVKDVSGRKRSQKLGHERNVRRRRLEIRDKKSKSRGGDSKRSTRTSRR